MSTHEIVCLSSDDEEKCEVLPIIVSTMSVAKVESDDFNNESFSSVIIDENTDEKPSSNGEKSNGGNEESVNGDASILAPALKKRKVDLTSVQTSSPTKAVSHSPKRKSRLSLCSEENKILFEQLLSKCENIENTADMRKATAKARRHHEAAQIEYVASKEFKSTLEKSLAVVTKECVWGYLGELVKQLKLYKEREGDLTGSQKEKDSMKIELAANDKNRYYEVLKSEENERTVLKLTRILKKLHKRILKLEKQEVDLDDEDSAYIMEERYKARAAKVYAKLCEYTNYPLHAERMTKCKISFNGTSIPEVNKCIERFVNKNDTFPDYHDVLKLIITVNGSEGLNMSSDEMKIMAGKAFRDIGREMKRRRQWDVEDSLYVHLDRDDTKLHIEADNDPDLQEKLSENGKIFVKKFNEIVEEYTQKQNERGVPGDEDDNSNQTDENGASTEGNDDDEDEEEEEENDACENEKYDVFQESDLGEENADSDEEPESPNNEAELVEDEGEYGGKDEVEDGGEGSGEDKGKDEEDDGVDDRMEHETEDGEADVIPKFPDRSIE